MSKWRMQTPQEIEAEMEQQKEKVIVKVKNKKNHVKAVEHLGKYSQHEPLLDEVIKTLDFLDKENATKN
mgnify:FL=1